MPTLLEQTMPVYHFHEVHSRRIAAPAPHVWDALTNLRLDQLTLTRALVALRHSGSAMPPSRPLFTDGPIRIVESVPPVYALGAAIGRPWQRQPARHDVTTLDEFVEFNQPGWTKYLTDFRLEPDDAGVVLSTETRGYSTDTPARRRFTAYWGLIRVGSGLIRRDILATVARQATAR